MNVMTKLVVVFLTFLQVAFGANFTYPDFKQCYENNVKSFVYFGDIRAVAVSEHLAVAYSPVKPEVAYEKHDPFLNLYLFRSKKTLDPVRLKSTRKLKLGEWIAGMDDNSLYVGNFSKTGSPLDSFYLHNAQMSPNSIISCLCCEVYGLGIGAGTFIGSEYITRFMNQEEVYYGDIGVRFAKEGKDFVVAYIDPFLKNQGFKKGDVIQRVNQKKIDSLKELNQIVLFAKPKSTITLQLKRDGKTQKVRAQVFKREGGGYLSDVFLEKKGIFFDKNMTVSHVDEGSFGQESGLKKGDKLLQVDDREIQDQDSLKEYLSNAKKKRVHLLFERDGFQFFIKLDLK